MLERLLQVLRNRRAEGDSIGQSDDPWSVSVYPLVKTLQVVDEQDLADLDLFLAGLGMLLTVPCRPTSQLGQEAFALGFNPPGPQVFVECGAAGPRFLSNTFQLQHAFSWRGLLIEPNPIFVVDLDQRASEHVHVVPYAAGTRGFIELVCAQELSTALEYIDVDGHAPERRAASLQGNLHIAKRLPLSAILDEYIPHEEHIGFLSVDVEGGEQDVLDSLDWKRWQPRTVAVEHNHRHPWEEDVNAFMTDRGYRRVLSRFTDWDAWYVLREVGKHAQAH